MQQKSDFRIAQAEGILPPEPGLTWERWSELVADIYAKVDISNFDKGGINPRFSYGEMRLARINWIYALCSRTRGPASLARGFFNETHDYTTMFRRNIALISASIVYIILVLTAMQVGLGTKKLQENDTFQTAAYVFTAFSILAPLSGLGLMLIYISGFLFLLNLRYTLTLRGKLVDQRAREWRNDAVKDYKH